MITIDGWKIVNLLVSDPDDFDRTAREWEACADGVRVAARGYYKRGETRRSLYSAEVCGYSEDKQLSVGVDLWMGTVEFLHLEDIPVQHGGISRDADTVIVEWIVSINGKAFLRATKL